MPTASPNIQRKIKIAEALLKIGAGNLTSTGVYGTNLNFYDVFENLVAEIHYDLYGEPAPLDKDIEDLVVEFIKLK